jgi:hypothetical protein
LDSPNQLVDLLAVLTLTFVAMMMNNWWFLIPPCLVLIGVLCFKPVKYFRRKSTTCVYDLQPKYLTAYCSIFIISIALARYLAGLNFLYFFRSFDQLFRSAIATGLYEWGANDHIAAVGTPLRYHWVAEASVGLVAKLSGTASLQVLTRFAPFVFTGAAISALWSLAKRFGLSNIGMALAIGSIFCLSGFYQTLALDTVRNPLEFALFFLFLNSLSDFQSSTQRLKFVFHIALLCPLILLTDTTIGVVVCATTVLIGLFNVLHGRDFKRDDLLLIAIGPLSLLFVRISILKSASDFIYNPIFGLNNFLQFGRTAFDIYSGQDRWVISMVSIAILCGGSFRWIGIYSTDNLKQLLHAPHIVCLVPALAGLLFANSFGIGASLGSAQQIVFLVGLVVLPLISADAITRDFANKRHKLRFWIPAVLLGVFVGFVFHNLFELEPGQNRQQGLIYITTIPVIVLLIIRGTEWFSKKSDGETYHLSRVARQGFQVAILISLITSSSFVLLVGARDLTKSIRDDHGYLGNSSQLECLKWIRVNTPKQSIVVSNLWHIPLPTQDPKYFLVSSQSERRVLIDGPLYVDNRLSGEVANRMRWSEAFINSPSTESFEYMKSMKVSIVYLDFKSSENRNLEPFAKTIFMNDGCLVAILN